MNKSLERFNFFDLVSLFNDMRVSNLSPLIIHSFDVAKIADLLVKRIYGSKEEIFNAYLSGLLHDIGLIAYTELKMPRGILIATKADLSSGGTTFDLDSLLYRIDKEYSHSAFSYAIAKKLKLLPEEYLSAILHHHTKLEDLSGSDKEVLLANVLNVADMIAQILRKNSMLGISDSIKVLFEFLDKYPMLDEVRKASRDLLKSYVEFGYILEDDPCLNEFCDFNLKLSMDQFVESLKVLVLLVDLRSPFTLRHTSGVAILARDMAREVLKTDFDSMVMYVSGLIHDLGKIKTPLEILHKPGSLDRHEFYVMKMHVVDTYKMLSRFPILEEFTAVASLHHERLDGSGYPWGLNGKELGIRARILQVSDVYEALTEDRPYRKGMNPEESLALVEKMVSDGKLDSTAYEALKVMIRNGYSINRSDIVVVEFFGDFGDVDEVQRALERISGALS